MPLRVGQFVQFNDDPACSGVVFEFQDDGNVAGINQLSEKLVNMGVEEETHEPVENLTESQAEPGDGGSESVSHHSRETVLKPAAGNPVLIRTTPGMRLVLTPTTSATSPRR